MSLTFNETIKDEAPLPHLSKRSVLNLAPLELDCMNTLWPMGEATVRAIRDRLAERRARAYTTIMTIMDRLARKGVVERRKTGRAYVYRPRLTAEEARAQALEQIIDGFFGGSRDLLVAHLAGSAGIRRAGAGTSRPEAAQRPTASGVEDETFAREPLDSRTV